MNEFGIAVAALIAESARVPVTMHQVAATEALVRWSAPGLSLDCLLSGALREQGKSFDCGGLTVQEGSADTLDFETLQLSNLNLQWCEINTVIISDPPPLNVQLQDCMVNRVVGAAHVSGLPGWIVGCEVAVFDNTNTNAAILKLPVPLPTRVLLTILRKLFLQRGRGRKLSAFHRGLNQQAEAFVAPLLNLLKSQGIAWPSHVSGDEIWHANRTERARVLKILASSGAATDPLIDEVHRLGR